MERNSKTKPGIAIEPATIHVVIALMRVLQKTAGSLLGASAVTLQLGNILICVFMLLAGPTVILKLLLR